MKRPSVKFQLEPFSKILKTTILILEKSVITITKCSIKDQIQESKYVHYPHPVTFWKRDTNILLTKPIRV